MRSRGGINSWFLRFRGRVLGLGFLNLEGGSEVLVFEIQREGLRSWFLRSMGGLNSWFLRFTGGLSSWFLRSRGGLNSWFFEIQMRS